MSENKTRTSITRELHKLVKDQYEELKLKGGKGITLEKVLEDLCTAGLEFQEQANQGLSGFTISDTGIKQPQKRASEYVIETKSELKAMQEAINVKEKKLIRRETHIDRREEIIRSRYELFFNDKDKLLADRMRVDRNFGVDEKLKIQDETIRDLKAENTKKDKEILILLKRINKNTDKGLLEQLVPVIAAVLSGATLYKTSNAQNNQSLDKSQQELLDLIKALLPDSQKEPPLEPGKFRDGSVIPPPPATLPSSEKKKSASPSPEKKK